MSVYLATYLSIIDVHIYLAGIFCSSLFFTTGSEMLNLYHDPLIGQPYYLTVTLLQNVFF